MRGILHPLNRFSRLQPVFRETRTGEMKYVINDDDLYITKITTGRVKKDAVRGARDEFGQLEMLKG